MMRPSLTPLLLAALAVPSGAQTVSEGVFTGTPAAVIAGPATTLGGGPMASNELHRKAAGFDPYAVVAGPAAVGQPDFSAAEIWGDGVAPPAFQIDAYSIGLDYVLAGAPTETSEGWFSWVSVPPGAWGAMTFSVTRDSQGKTGGLIESERLATNGAGADLFSLVFKGSTIATMPCYSWTHPQRGLDAGEAGVGSPGPNGGELVAVDWFTPLYETGNPVRSRLPGNPKVFFSVTHEDADPAVGVSPVPAAWWDGTAPSGATVLVTEWNPSALGWSTPRPFLTYDLLGLDVDDDVDAIAVDLDDELMLFSIENTPASTLAEQLQVVAWTITSSFSGATMSTTTGDYVTTDEAGNRQSVAERSELAADDDVDGLCTIDPGEQGDATDIAIATPVGTITPFKTIPASLFRDENSAGPTITMTASNIPTGPTVPLQNLEIWAGVPLGGGGYTLLPAPLHSEPLNGSDPSGTRSVSFTSPALAVLNGVEVELFWIIRPAGAIQSSVRLAIEI